MGQGCPPQPGRAELGHTRLGWGHPLQGSMDSTGTIGVPGEGGNPLPQQGPPPPRFTAKTLAPKAGGINPLCAAFHGAMKGPAQTHCPLMKEGGYGVGGRGRTGWLAKRVWDRKWSLGEGWGVHSAGLELWCMELGGAGGGQPARRAPGPSRPCWAGVGPRAQGGAARALPCCADSAATSKANSCPPGRRILSHHQSSPPGSGAVVQPRRGPRPAAPPAVRSLSGVGDIPTVAMAARCDVIRTG